jgi:adenosylmethionine-8-amino-7-oxononanoate aminotransferase
MREPIPTSHQATMPSAKKETVANGFTNGNSNKKDLCNGIKSTGFLMERDMKREFPVVTGGKDNYIYLSDGRHILDATCGAAVSCIGYGNQRVIDAITRQLTSGTPYLCSTFWSCDVVEELCKELISGTGNKMSRVYLSGSGWFLVTPIVLYIVGTRF